MNKEQRLFKIELLIIDIAIIASILSFSSFEVIAEFCHDTRYVFWLLALFVIYIQSRIKLNFTIKYMAFVAILFILLSQVFHLLGVYNSSSTGLAGYMGFCVLFYTVGYNFKWFSTNDIKKLFIACFVGYVVLMITTIPEVAIYKDAIYLFAQKNQLGQMLGSGLIIIAFFLAKVYKSLIIKVILYMCSGISLIMLMHLHSRTPLIALVVIAIVNFISKKGKNQRDYFIALSIVLGVVLMIAYLGGIEFIKELFEWDENTNLNTVEGINDVTSGRIDGYIEALSDIIKSPLIGTGFNAYIDNFVLCCLRSGGLLFALFAVPFIYSKMFRMFSATRHITEKDKPDSLIVNLKHLARNYTLYFFVVSIMEGFPPIGPGASIFLLWLIYGLTDNGYNLRKLQEAEEYEQNEIAVFSNMK